MSRAKQLIERVLGGTDPVSLLPEAGKVEMMRPKEEVVSKERKSRLWREIEISAPYRFLDYFATPKTIVRAKAGTKYKDRGWAVYLHEITETGRSKETLLYGFDSTKDEAMYTAKVVLMRAVNTIVYDYNAGKHSLSQQR